MRIFNSIQLVALFIAFPFLLQWLHSASFPFSGAAFYAAAAIYFIQVVMTAGAYHDFLKND